jgi:hypothetical protein
VSGRLALLLAVAAASCQDREVVGAVPVKSVLVMAASGGLITVTADEDPVLAGMFLRIPPGSLPRDLTVTIERGGQDLASSTTLPAGPVVIVGPLGTQLSIRTTLLGLPVTQATTSDRLFIEVRETDGRRATLAAATGPDAPGAQAYIDQFAAFQAVRLPPGAAAPDGGLPPPPPAPPAAR